MNQQLASGPSERAVAIARVWLVVWGIVLVAFGIAIASTADGSTRLWGGAMVALGIGHFIAARYASGKVAVVVAWFGP
jgi:hypothetical protein